MARFATTGATAYGHHPIHLSLSQGIHHEPRCCCRGDALTHLTPDDTNRCQAAQHEMFMKWFKTLE
jgi:hypothetical protein